MLKRSVQKQLLLMHYDRLWIKSGLLEEAWLAEQVETRKASGEQDYLSLEPYHFDSFQRILDTRERLTDEQIADYVTLALKRGRGAQDAELCLLIGWRGLLPHQLPLVREQLLANLRFPFTGLTPRVIAALDRRAYLFSLAIEPLTDDAFARHMASGDPDVQEALLKRKDLDAAQLDALAERGASRTVRETATARRQELP